MSSPQGALEAMANQENGSTPSDNGAAATTPAAPADANQGQQNQPDIPQDDPQRFQQVIKQVPDQKLANPGIDPGTILSSQGGGVDAGSKPADTASADAGQGAPNAGGNAPASSDTHEKTADEWVKELSGGAFDSWDKVKEKLNAPAPAPQFANDTSKKLHEALVLGKNDEVRQYLNRQHEAANVANLSDEEVVKAKLKQDFPSLTDSQLDDEYAERYHLEEPDELNLNERELESAKRKYDREKTKIGDRIKRDAESARQYFTASAEKIELPDFGQQAAQPAASVELSEQAKKIVSFGESFSDDKVSNVDFQFKSNDNTVQANGSFKVSAEELKPIIDQIGANPEAFLMGLISKRWGKNGSGEELDPAAIARDVYFLSNPDKFAGSVASQMHRQLLEQWLRANKNYNPSAQNAAPATSLLPGGEQANDSALDKFFGIPAAKPGQNY